MPGPNTTSIHGANKHTLEGEHVYPLYQTSTFVFDNVAQGAKRFAGKEEGYIYSRLGNPTVDLLEKRLALLEEGDIGKIYPTGMAAISTVLEGILSTNDHIITDSIIYGCTDSLFRSIFKRLGIQVSFIDTTNTKKLKETLQKNTKVVFLETPANPTMKTIDIKKVSKITHKYNKDIKIVVDNTFATPYYQKPLTLGADVSIHSCTKYLNGHGDVIAGAAIFNKELKDILSHTQSDLGTTTSPFDCWLILRGLKTFPLRMKQHTKNSKKIVQYLKKHPKITYVNYPGFSGVLTFGLKGGFKAGKKLLNSVKLISLAVSLGNVDSLIQHPASMTHAIVPKAQREKVGITDDMVRMSVGIEDIEDLIADLDQALKKVK
jgi:methionine-gamma-lyase